MELGVHQGSILVYAPLFLQLAVLLFLTADNSALLVTGEDVEMVHLVLSSRKFVIGCVIVGYLCTLENRMYFICTVI